MFLHRHYWLVVWLAKNVVISPSLEPRVPLSVWMNSQSLVFCGGNVGHRRRVKKLSRWLVVFRTSDLVVAD